MMGQQAGAQDELFYSFNLDAHVPADHLLRGIDRFLDLGELRRHLASFYSHTGRPSIDPELMMRMLIIGYCFGIRSERRLCDEVHLNLAYRWFCRLGLQDPVPEHSTFSKNRHGRFRDSDAFRHLFETVLQRCIAEGLVGGEGFAIDASVVKADASRDSAVAWKQTGRSVGSMPRRPRAQCASTWKGSTRKPAVGSRPTARASRSPIRRPSGPVRRVAQPSSATPPTTWSMCGLASSSMSRPRAPIAPAKSMPPAR